MECPDEIPEFGQWKIKPPAYHYTLANKDGFLSLLTEKTGAGEKDLRFGSYLAYSAMNCEGSPDPTNQNCGVEFTGFPDISTYVPPDPRELVGPSLPLFKSLAQDLHNFKNFVSADSYYEIVEATSIVTGSLAQSLDSMQNIVAQWKKIEHQEMVEMVTMFLTAFFAFLPMLGEVLEEAAAEALVAVGRMLTYVGELGDVGLELYAVATDPLSALTFAFRGLLYLREFSRTAFFKDKMEVEVLDKLGLRASTTMKQSNVIRGEVMCHRFA